MHPSNESSDSSSGASKTALGSEPVIVSGGDETSTMKDVNMAPMWRRLLALLMVFGLVAAACGSDGDGGEVSGGYKIIYLVDREDAPPSSTSS